MKWIRCSIGSSFLNAKNGKYKKADNKGHSDNKYQKWKYKEVSRQSSRFVPKTGDSVTVTNVIALFGCVVVICCLIYRKLK